MLRIKQFWNRYFTQCNMFHGGGPPGGRYPRQYGPNCRIPAPFNQSQGPSMATGFGAQVGSYNQPPGVPCGPFVPRQFDSNRYTFPAFYHSNSEASRSSSAGLSYPSPGPGNGQGPCGAAPGENVGLQLNPSLPSAGFSGDQTQTSVSNDPLGLQVYRKVNCPSQDDIENERAGEEFLRCLAAKEKLPNMAMDMFQELLLGGQLKDQEALLALSKMIALKKQLRAGSHGQTGAQTSQSPVNILGEHRSSSLPRETQSLPRTATKGIDPSLSASIQGQTGEPRYVQTMQMEGEALNAGQYAKPYGAVKQEAEEENVGEFLLPHERVRHDSSGFSRILGMMGDMPHLPEKRKLLTDIEDEEAFLYGEEDKAKVAAKTMAGEQPAAVDFNRVKKALMTIGLDLGKAEISKMAARKQEQQTNHISESPQHKGASSSGGMSPRQNRGLKRNISPSLDMFSDSHSSAKQALYSGVPSGSVREERDTSSQEKESRGIPFFTWEDAEKPLATPNMLTSPFGFETGILGKIPPSMAEAWPQKPIVPAPHSPAVDLQLLEPLKGVLESMKATSKASGMDILVDLANQSGNVKTSQKQKSSGWNTKVSEDALEQMKRKDYLLQELESLLRREVSEFVVPVIGFCCKLCEEFFGDVASAQEHATCQSHKEKCMQVLRFSERCEEMFNGRRSMSEGKTDLREITRADLPRTQKEETEGSRSTNGHPRRSIRAIGKRARRFPSRQKNSRGEWRLDLA
ncbi:hypothetical protein GJAV_G00242670 [Gymnothorax javanicus]|nr:hypothetical protein GJAV_G00242670 [Gymnothorax javanicus]